MSEYAEFIDVDDDSMTWDGYQYAQVGQVHCLGDEVRELRRVAQKANQYALKMEDECNQLREKVEKQDRELRYWRGAFFNLSLSVASVLTLYGWGHDMDYVDGLSRVRKGIQALRQRIRELKGR